MVRTSPFQKYYLMLMATVSAINIATAQQINTLDTSTGSRTKLLDEVVVTGQYKPQSLKNSVYKVRVITQDQIKMRGATDLIGTLNTELGIRFSTDYVLGETDIQLMGMSGNNVKILLDGVPIVDRGDTRQSLSQTNIHDVERVEIVEGPMSVVYGTDALAGVINIITKKNITAATSYWSATATLQEETVPKEYKPLDGEGLHNQTARIGYNHKSGLYASVNYGRNRFGGWTGNPEKLGRNKEGKPKNQDLAGIEFGYNKNNLNIWYRLNYLYEDISGQGLPQPGDPVVGRQAFLTDRYTHMAQADWKLNERWNINSALSYQNYERRTRNMLYNIDTKQEFLDPNATQDVSIFKTSFFRIMATYNWNDKINLQPGIEIKSDQSSGQRIHNNDGIVDYALFITGEIKPWSQLNIRPGFRFVKNSVYDAPPVIPSLNIKYDFADNWTIRASYARGFRAPALRELYFTFHDASHDIEGNPDLKAEYSNSYTLILSQNNFKIGNLQTYADVSIFYNDFRDRIAYAMDPQNPSWSTLVNIDRFKTTGGTTTAKFLYKNVKGSIGVSYIGRYNSLYNTSEQSKNIDRYLWSSEINSNVAYLFKKVQTTLALFYKYTGKVPGYTNTTVNGENKIAQTEIQGYHWLDCTASKTFGKLFTINGGAKNILNITRLSNTNNTSGAHSSGGPVLRSYGRSFFLGLVFSWNSL